MTGSGRIFTFNATSSDATAVDPATGKAVGTVALGGKPEAASADGAGTIFVNIEDKSELVAFDAKTLAVKAALSPDAPANRRPAWRWIPRHGRIFSGCDNKMIAVTDMKTGKVVTTDSHRRGRGRQPFRSRHRSGLQFQRRKPAPDHRA